MATMTSLASGYAGFACQSIVSLPLAYSLMLPSYPIYALILLRLVISGTRWQLEEEQSRLRPG